MKTLGNTESTTQPGKGRLKVDGNGRAKRDGKCRLGGSEIDGGKVNGGEFGEDKVGRKSQKMSKSKLLSKSKKMVGSLDFFTPRAKLVFTKLR